MKPWVSSPDSCKPSMAVHSCNDSTGVMGRGRSEGQGYPRLHSEFKFQVSLGYKKHFKNKNEKAEAERMALGGGRCRRGAKCLPGKQEGLSVRSTSVSWAKERRRSRGLSAQAASLSGAEHSSSLVRDHVSKTKAE